MAAKVKARSLFDKTILIPAIWDSFRKLDPRLMVRNPVMFVALVGAVVTTAKFFNTPLHGGSFGFFLQIALWLWFTVLFANFAEAMAEGRGKAQAATLRKARTQTMANRRLPNGSLEPVPAESLRKDDIFVVKAGEMIPADGEVIEGAATVDESAITGESAPVIREAGGDRSAVTGGTRVLSDEIVVRVTANPGESFHGPDDRSHRGRQPPEDPQRNRPDHPAGGPDHHLSGGHCDPETLWRLFRGYRSPCRCWPPCWSA